MQNRDELLQQPLKFNFWTWGQDTRLNEFDKPKCCSVSDRIAGITPAQFLPYYYGYVIATRKLN